jgi:Tfp pilus assembly protein PilF
MAGRRARWLILLMLLQPGCVLLDSTQRSTQKPAETMLPANESAKACQAVAEKLALQGHIDHAIEELLKARAFDRHADVSPVLARLYARKNEDRLALDEFAQALKDHSKDPNLWNDLGYFHYQRGRWDEAEKNYRKVVELDDENNSRQRGWTNLGLTLGQKGQYPEALAAFEKANRPADARCNLAFVLCTQGKIDQAKEQYQEALKIDPGSKLARNALAKLDHVSQVKPPVATPASPLSGSFDPVLPVAGAKPGA